MTMPAPMPAGQSARKPATRSSRKAKDLSPFAGRGRFPEFTRMSAVEPVSTASAQEPERILRVNNIEVIYDHVILVLKGVSLDVPKGGIVALLGANGAGKTTPLKAISDLLHAERGDVTKGSIIFDGAEVHDMSPTDL